jgi:hypothetical protein
MAFQLSPGVVVVEKDFSTIIPAVSTSAGAVAGVFSWGPISEPTTITSEDELVKLFGRPSDSTFKSFYTAANFLSYTNNLIINRVDTSGNRNAVSSTTGEVLNVTITSGGSGFRPGHDTTVTFSAPQTSGGTTATGTVILSGGAVTGFSITGGSGYTVAPTVTISAPEIEGGIQAQATAVITDGVVTAITLTPGFEGSGYLNPPTVTIDAAPLGGTNASATATVAASSISAIKITNGGSGYTAAPTVTITASNQGTVGTVTLPTVTAVISTGTGVKIRNTEHYTTDFRDYQQSVYGMFATKYAGTKGNGIRVILVDNAVWTWANSNSSNSTASLILNSFEGAPGTSSQASAKNISNDELHVLVLDDTRGTWTGTPSSVLEKFSYLSKIRGVVRPDGTNTYFRDAINSGSEYLWVINTPSSQQVNDPQNLDWNQHIDTVAFGVNLRDLNSVAQMITLGGGVDDFSATDGNIQSAYAQLTNADLYDISLIAAGDVSATTANYIINSVAEVRRDCVAFISPRNSDGTPIIASGSAGVTAIKSFKTSLTNSTYAVLDSGWKYQYDRYNDVYRWVPLNGDIAGLCARTDYTADPWFSPGGFTRGQIKNAVKLGFNPNQTERDNLYKEGVNPVVTFPGQGTVLFGDKTYTLKPSAFDRINVRRLFIVLEKAIATAAKFQLFEFNDEFTRAQFRNLVEPFLRNVQGRRGIVDFRVKCDATNNTSDVIDRNEFVASIFIKPNKSINFITLNFVAARSSVSFEEIGG